MTRVGIPARRRAPDCSIKLTACFSDAKCFSTIADVVIKRLFQVRLMQPITWPPRRIGIAIELRSSFTSARVLK